jgi:hypothetical protein
LKIKRSVARFRPEVDHLDLVINENGRPYRNWGVDAMMDRLQEVVGFRIHAMVSGKRSRRWQRSCAGSSEHLRSAMGRLEDWTSSLPSGPKSASAN